MRRWSRLSSVCVALAIASTAAHSEVALDAIDPPAGPGAIAPNLWNAGDSVLLSWLEPVEGERAAFAFRFARFADGAWSEPRTIAQRSDFFANWADLPSIAEHPDGWLLAHWLQRSGPGPYAYDIVLARSTDRGETWTTLGRAHDDETQTEHGFVSRLIEDDGIRLFWLDGRDMAPGTDDDEGHGEGDMALRTALIRDGKVTESVVLDPRVCECCGTSAAMTSSGPIIAYRDLSDEGVRDISIVRHVDGKWTEPMVVHDDGWAISGCPVNGPAIAARGERVAVAWHTGAGLRPRVMLAFSDDAGASFSEPIVIDDDEPLGRVDLVIDESGTATVCWLSSDESSGDAFVSIRWADFCGKVGEAIPIAQTSGGRSSGFPRMTLRRGGERLIVWRDPEGRLRTATTSHPLKR